MILVGFLSYVCNIHANYSSYSFFFECVDSSTFQPNKLTRMINLKIKLDPLEDSSL